MNFNFSSLGNTLMTILIWLLIVIIPIIITILIIRYYKKVLRYKEYAVKIFTTDGAGNIWIKRDNGGVFEERRTKARRLWLKKAEVGLSPDNIPFIMNQNGKKEVYLLQTGAKNYRYLKFDINNQQFGFKVGEDDVNWGLLTYEINKRQFQNDKLLQYMPYISLVLVSMVILIMFIYLFRNFGVLKTAAQYLAEATKNMKMIQNPVLK